MPNKVVLEPHPCLRAEPAKESFNVQIQSRKSFPDNLVQEMFDKAGQVSLDELLPLHSNHWTSEARKGNAWSGAHS